MKSDGQQPRKLEDRIKVAYHFNVERTPANILKGIELNVQLLCSADPGYDFTKREVHIYPKEPRYEVVDYITGSRYPKRWRIYTSVVKMMRERRT